MTRVQGKSTRNGDLQGIWSTGPGEGDVGDLEEVEIEPAGGHESTRGVVFSMLAVFAANVLIVPTIQPNGLRRMETGR
jgi:hypothetical protein